MTIHIHIPLLEYLRKILLDYTVFRKKTATFVFLHNSDKK